MSEDEQELALLPHHQQQDLCQTRLPYRQGRKLTAVKVYSINNESRHLLVFGVPSLNLRQETKALFSKFGKLQLHLTKYPSEQFTETFHAIYENIQAARVAKRMLDTKNFYGGCLHISYAPEFENITDTREKLLLRQKNVVYRLKNLSKSLDNKEIKVTEKQDVKEVNSNDKLESEKVFMGNANEIKVGANTSSKEKIKRKVTDYKSVKHCKLKKSRNFDRKSCVARVEKSNEKPKEATLEKEVNSVPNSNVEIIDCTSTEKEVVTNINEALNYNKFGNEIIKPVPYKSVNKIKFNLNKK